MQPIRLWREDGFHEDGSPGWWNYNDMGGLPIPGSWTEYAALPRAEYDALVKERDSLRGEVATIRGARSAEDVCEMLCEASCVDVTQERCDRIWSLLEHPATTMTTLAVIADERGESYTKAAAERDAATARAEKAECACAVLREQLFELNEEFRGARVVDSLIAYTRADKALALLREARREIVDLTNENGNLDLSPQALLSRIDALLGGKEAT